MNRFGAVVESFSRFSRLLDANFDALHGSFASILRLLDVFGEFFYVIRTFAVFRLLFGGFRRGWRILNWILGRHTATNRLQATQEGLEVADYKDFQSNQRRQKTLPMMFVILGVICVSLPLLFVRMWKAVNRLKLLQDLEEPDRMEDVWSGELHTVRAKHTFAGESEMDLPFREGDLIKVIGKPFPEWWEGELNGRKGLFPANFVELVEPEKKKMM